MDIYRPSLITSPVDWVDPVNADHPTNKGAKSWIKLSAETFGGGGAYDLIRKARLPLSSGFVSTTGFQPTTRVHGGGELRYNSLVTAVDCYIDTGLQTSALGLLNAYTVAIWAYKTNSTVQCYFSDNTNSFNAVDNESMSIWENPAGQVSWVGKTVAASSAAGTFPNNTWTHLLATYNTTVATVYINGVSGGSVATGAATYSSPITIRLGIRGQYGSIGGASPWHLTQASWDDFRLWDSCFNADQVAELYRESLAGYPGALNRVGPSILLMGSSSANQTLSPTGIASAEAFGVPTVSVGAVSLSPTGIASAEAFGTATIATGAVTISPTGIASAEAFGTATVTLSAPSSLTLSPTGIASAEAFGVATVSVGALTLSFTGIASSEAFGVPTVSGGTAAADLVEALTTFLATDPTITSLYPGGWWNSAASVDAGRDPAGQATQAYGVFQILDSDVRNILKPGYSIETKPIHFWSMSPHADQANALGRQLRDVLLGKTVSGTFTPPATFLFVDGTETARYLVSGSMQSIDDVPGLYNDGCFRHLLPVAFVVARGG